MMLDTFAHAVRALARATLITAGLLCSVVAAHTARASVLWTTNPNLPTSFSNYLLGPSAETPALDREVADDFNVIGAIERIVADGVDCNNGCFGGQPVTGVYVRFYEWSASGPGALLSEQFVAEGEPGFDWSRCCGPSLLEIDLPTPFVASGWHFVSVQVSFAGTAAADRWHWHRANVGNARGMAAQYRDGDGSWSDFHTAPGWPPSDASFRLEGQPGGPPPPQLLSIAGGAPVASGRVQLNGSYLGAGGQGDAVRIGGQEAIVTQWTADTIIAYVPESTPVGMTTVELVIDGEIMDSLAVSIGPRQRQGRVLWRFAVDANYVTHRPGVAADGSVYVNDLQGRLYKIAADGALLWIVDALRGQSGSGAEGPVVVGDDGTVYVVVNPLGPAVDLVAYAPDGTERWTFTEPIALSAAAGPGIGPDGNVYVAFHHPAGASLGLVSLTSDGQMRWSNPGNPPLYEYGGIGAELQFGASAGPGSDVQVILTVDRDLDPWLYAFALTSGQQRWAVPRSPIESLFLQFQTQPATGPDGAVYLTDFTGAGGLGWGLRAFNADDGTSMWRFDPDIASDASGPVTGPDSTIYFTWDVSRVSAVTPAGQERWTHVDFGLLRTPPSVGANGTQVLVGGGAFGQPGRFISLDALSGAELWRVDLPQESGDVVPDARAVFDAAGTTAYFPTLILNDSGPYPYCYIYALDLQDDADGDGIGDASDNCRDVANADQIDSDGDGYGNLCDADLNGDCIVNVTDLGLLRSAYFSADANADFNSDGVVNTIDLGIMRAGFFQAPGPAVGGTCN